MTNDANNQEKRERTKTVMLGPDITKEIRSQLEEYNLTKVLGNDENKENPKEKIEDSLPSSFFYNAGSEETKIENDDNVTNDKEIDSQTSNNDDSDYSIFGGENPIEELQNMPERNDEEVLVNNRSNKDYQMNELSRSKKETEEIASKIIKDLILDNDSPQTSVKDSLIKEIEEDNSMFEKFEHKDEFNNNSDANESTNEDDFENIFSVPSGKILEGNRTQDSFETQNDETTEDTNEILQNNDDSNPFSEDLTNSQQIKDDEYDDRKATQLNLEARISNADKLKNEGIFWKNETPLVGFLVTFSNNPNGEFYDLREGKLVITSQINKNMSSLVINDESVSMMHAIMKISNDKISLLDQFSENGTTIKHFGSSNVVELSGESEYIQDKDIITFGNVTFKVCLI